jgi:Papain family cysteine protease
MNNKTLVGSEQDMIDCDIFVYGCGGGWPTSAFEYVKRFGISDGKKYKYENSQQMCRKKLFPSVYNISEFEELYLEGDEEALKALVAKHPVAVAFDVTIDFMYYRSGVFIDNKCTNEFNHAMVKNLN